MAEIAKNYPVQKEAEHPKNEAEKAFDALFDAIDSYTWVQLSSREK